MLPEHVRSALERLLEGVSRNDLAERSRRLTEGYRRGRPSTEVVRTNLDALAYVVARLPATYAAVGEALQRWIACVPDLAPVSVLDLGSGPGSASLAAQELFASIEAVTQFEINPHFLSIAGQLNDHAGRAATAREAVNLLEGMRGKRWPDADVVLLTYVLVELSGADARKVVSNAFERARAGLVLVEPGTPKGFEALRMARTALIDQGAHILAPCPGHGPCPMTGDDWCHFSVRLPRLKDHKLIKGAAVPFEDERYAYLVASRAPAAPWRRRVLASPIVSRGQVDIKLCAPDGLHRHVVKRSDKLEYKTARRVAWGDEL